MSKSIRTTIMLNEILHSKIREIQAKHIKRTKKSISFSSTINQILAAQLDVEVS